MPEAAAAPSADDLAHISPDLRALAVPVEVLNKDPHNARVHPMQNLEDIRRSLKRFGQREVIVVNRNGMTVEAGNARLKVALELGWKYVAVSHEDDDPMRAAEYGIVSNRSAEKAEWDDAVLTRILKEAVDYGTDLADLGFSDREYQKLIAQAQASAPKPDDGTIIATPAQAVSKHGEIYELGPHRVICGDSTDPEVYDAVLQGKRIQCGVTDPPYGVSYEEKMKTRGPRFESKTRPTSHIANDSLTGDALDAFLDRFMTLMLERMAKGRSYYIFGPSGGGPGVTFTNVTARHGLRHILVWVKERIVMGRADYHYQHEPIFYGWKPGGTHYFIDDRSQSSVLTYDRPHRSDLHPTMKPLPLLERLILNSSKERWLVFDPFLGSGSTLMAAAKTNRVCCGIELSPLYCDVIRRRWTTWAQEAGIDPGAGALA